MILKRLLVPLSSIFVLIGASINGIAPGQPLDGSIVVEDFESYSPDGLPTRWQYIDSRRKLVPVSGRIMADDEYFVVASEGNNKFLRAVTFGRAHRLVLVNKEDFHWNLQEYPELSWRWRAIHLPVGAREDMDNRNDSGAAIYVTFSRDLLGRPKSIKYSYSSTLPEGTIINYGRLKVIVASSGLNGTKKWTNVKRDIARDYQMVFNEKLNSQPVSIMLWSDSNSVKDRSEVDFDDISLWN